MQPLYQQTIVELFRRLQSVDGWEVLEREGLLALKAPVSGPAFNVAWAAPEPAILETVQTFYGEHAFTWALAPGWDDGPLRAAGFQAPETTVDLVLDLADYAFPGYGPGVTVSRAYSSQDFRFWAATAAEALGLDPELMRAFYLPLVRHAGCVPFLGLRDGVPAAVAMAFCGDGATGIYALGTREAHRGHGLGPAVAHACLRLAQNHGSERAVLSAPALGVSLPRKLGFRVERMVREYVPYQG